MQVVSLTLLTSTLERATDTLKDPIKDIINPCYCLLKNTNLLIKTTIDQKYISLNSQFTVVLDDIIVFLYNFATI